MQQKVLIITSSDLHPGNLYSSNFELSLARGLQNTGINVSILSVYMITPWNLFKAFLIRALFNFKRNEIAERFSFSKIAGIFLSYFLGRKRYFVLHHQINGIKVVEVVGISKIVNEIEKTEEFGAAWVNAGMRGFNTVKKSGSVDLIHAHSRFYFGISLAHSIYRSFGVPYIITEHSSYYSRGLVTLQVRKHLKQIYDEAAVAVAVSISLAKKIKEVTGTQSNIQIIANALDPIYENIELKTDPQKEFTIISVARFDENKNQALLLKAFAGAALPVSRLILIGKGETEEMLRSLVSELSIDEQVQFKGHLPSVEVKDLMLSADLLVVSSIVETFSVVTIEAHACGLPVLSTPCGGPNELIDEENGIVLKGFSESEMTAALQEMYHNYSRYNKTHIRRKAIEKYSANAIAMEYTRLYCKLSQNSAS